MKQRECLHCRKPFIKRLNVPSQQYCGEKECQRARRAKWQKQKMQTDTDYQEYQKKAVQRWHDANPGYMSKYRREHPHYCERERMRLKNSRSLKHTMRQQTPGPLSEGIRVVKMDESNNFSSAQLAQLLGNSEYFQLRPFSGDSDVKMDAYLVKLTVIQRDTVGFTVPS